MPKLKINGVEITDECTAFLIERLKMRAKSCFETVSRSVHYRRYLCLALHNVNLLLYNLGDDGPKNELEITPGPDIGITELGIDEVHKDKFWKYTGPDTSVFDRNGISDESPKEKAFLFMSVEIDGEPLGTVLAHELCVSLNQVFILRTDIDSFIFDRSEELLPYWALVDAMCLAGSQLESTKRIVMKPEYEYKAQKPSSEKHYF